MPKEKDTKIEEYNSIKEAYEAGKRAGLIEGYIRATESLKAAIPLLQGKFIEKIDLAYKLDKEQT